jgi:hypothetical protein
MTDHGAALREAFMKEIEMADPVPPTVAAVMGRIKEKRRRRWVFGGAVAALLLTGGAGTVIASSMVDENGESSAIISVDPGHAVPSGASGVVLTEGTTKGRVWQVRSFIDERGYLCHRELDPVTKADGMGACGSFSIGPDNKVTVDRINWSGSSLPNGDGTWTYEVNGNTSNEVDHVELSWKGAAGPVVMTATQLSPEIRVFHAKITAQAGSPKFSIKPFDASGKPFGSIDPPK